LTPVARDAAGRDDGEEALLSPGEGAGRKDEIERGRAHADYLSRGPGVDSPFYDAIAEGVDGAARAADWAARDKRHFRLIVAPERGELIADLPAFTREVMARAEAQLGARLSWVAVDHHDTDNPHTHLILRGRRPLQGRATPLRHRPGRRHRGRHSGRAPSAPRPRRPHD
jgi:type IV secretory pathway VirD2 relaxase